MSMGVCGMSDSEKVAVGAKVDLETRKQLRVLAAKRDTSMSALLREQIDDLLDADAVEQPAD